MINWHENIEILRVDDRTGKKDISRPERCKRANEWGADIYISFHHNAVEKSSHPMVNGVKCFSGGGTVVYVCKGLDKNGTTRTMQRDLYEKLIKHTGLKGNRSNPYGQANFDVLVLTDMTALLIENGFMDSYYDVPIILSNEFVEQTSEAIVEFIANNFDVKLKKIVETTYKVRKSWEDSKGQKGSFVILQNAIAEAQKYGYNVYDNTGKLIWEYQPEKEEEPKAETPSVEPTTEPENAVENIPTVEEQPEKEKMTIAKALKNLLKLILEWINK